MDLQIEEVCRRPSTVNDKRYRTKARWNYKSIWRKNSHIQRVWKEQECIFLKLKGNCKSIAVPLIQSGNYFQSRILDLMRPPIKKACSNTAPSPIPFWKLLGDRCPQNHVTWRPGIWEIRNLIQEAMNRKAKMPAMQPSREKPALLETKGWVAWSENFKGPKHLKRNSSIYVHNSCFR